MVEIFYKMLPIIIGFILLVLIEIVLVRYFHKTKK